MTSPIRRPSFVSEPARTGELRPGRHLAPVSTPSRRGRGSSGTADSPATSSRHRHRPKAFFAYVTAGVMFSVMVTQMLLSVATESGAYEIAGLQTANKEALRSFQQLTQEIDRFASPQHLALNAEALGMLSNNTPAYLRLSDGAVLGAPTSGDGFTNLVANDGGSLVPNALLADVPIITSVPTTDSASGSPPAGADVGAPTALVSAGPVALSNGLPGLSTR